MSSAQTPSRARFIMALVLLLSAIWSPRLQADLSDTRYDYAIHTSAERFLPAYDWRWLKAQCYQESLLDPRAVSIAGAMGLCQLMPSTWHAISEKLRLNASPINPKANALAAGYYMGRLIGQWHRDRANIEKLRLAQASYNAGLGSVLNAQKRCHDALLWRCIEPCLGYPETRNYVIKIERWYNQLTTVESE